ncbi:DUF4397 domain-containing protein [Flavobacterium salilacus subsp. salilacus]|uniref:T9SS type A sorting domain-containing protein n=1 Tax=Flavobacterium TaxID=237 RepID=UPI0013C2DA4A|nr:MULTISPECIES: DUF4397 domain-containing protein [Flavobacterium]KAF2519277.1 DUF4397 domain-containing protein [Flavobacterium salilacus subsp. salilacus]MBE1613462.1 DUF4397 domain-containing protein [Flavobacterium sp. SaA2.13]
MKKLTLPLLLFLFSLTLPVYAQTARVKVIHNSPDLAAEEVDVYLNGGILLDNFAFRTATQFIDAPAGTPITLVVAPGTSSSADDDLYTLTTTLTANETYIIVANGIVSTTGYSPLQPFELTVFSGARENASETDAVDMLVMHGSPDAPTVDVVETSVPVGTIINDISYPEFGDEYLELIPGDYTIDITDASGTTVVASYLAPLQSLELEGQALTVLASGFLNPAANSDGPAFGLWAVTGDGEELIELPLANQTARVKVIHNAADLAAQEVDVYLNGEILIDNFAFRTATPFIDAPAGQEISIDIAPGDSESASESLYNLTTTLEADESYILIANGIISQEGYEPNQEFDLYVYAMAREEANEDGNTDILVFHGATDAPTVDVVAQGAGTIVDNIAYGDFNGYLELATDDYVLDVTTADGNTVVASYQAPLELLELEGEALTVLASGFLNPGANSDGPEFGLWVVTGDGEELIELPAATLNNTNFERNELVIYPNPASSTITINTPFATTVNYSIYDVSGRNIITSSTTNDVDVSGLQNGMYMLQLNANGIQSQHKIVIKK